jgi:hypothetical protein
MKLFFWRKTKKLTLAHSSKALSSNCSKHPFIGKCLCGRCFICIEEETGMTIGGITYASYPRSSLIICNQCLTDRTDEELAEYYADFSTKVWHRPVDKAVVLATLIKKPSTTTAKFYIDSKGRHAVEMKNLVTGAVNRNIWEGSTCFLEYEEGTISVNARFTMQSNGKISNEEVRN